MSSDLLQGLAAIQLQECRGAPEDLDWQGALLDQCH